MRKLEPLFAHLEGMSRGHGRGEDIAPAQRRGEPRDAAEEEMRQALAIASATSIAGGIRKVLGIPYL